MVIGGAAGFVVQAAAALVLLATRRIGLRGELPFGPAMLLGALLAIGWSDTFFLRAFVRQRRVIPISVGHSYGGSVSPVRVSNAQVCASSTRQPPQAARPGQPIRTGPARPSGAPMLNPFATSVTLVSFARTA